MTKRDFESRLGAILLDRQDEILREVGKVANEYPEEKGKRILEAASRAVCLMQEAYDGLLEELKKEEV